MRQLQVKICGLNNAAGLDAAVAAGADWIGLVFFPPSPRAISPGQAATLSARALSVTAGGPGRVGLFVDPVPEVIEATLAAVPLDALQLYGKVGDLHALRARFGLPIWHAVGIATASDLPTDAGGADALVIEAKPPPDATRPGGNAASFDWSLLSDWTAPAPWILAGGLTPANVAEAIRVSGAPCVDVSSGVECARGIKDPALIRAFIANARSA
jgi:phosphoribosylanthranilate isomerase